MPSSLFLRITQTLLGSKIHEYVLFWEQILIISHLLVRIGGSNSFWSTLPNFALFNSPKETSNSRLLYNRLYWGLKKMEVYYSTEQEFTSNVICDFLVSKVQWPFSTTGTLTRASFLFPYFQDFISYQKHMSISHLPLSLPSPHPTPPIYLLLLKLQKQPNQWQQQQNKPFYIMMKSNFIPSCLNLIHPYLLRTLPSQQGQVKSSCLVRKDIFSLRWILLPSQEAEALQFYPSSEGSVFLALKSTLKDTQITVKW